MVNLMIFIVLFFVFVFPRSNSITFNFPNFQPLNSQNISFEGNASLNGDQLQLTTNQLNISLEQNVGRASYAYLIPLWDANTNNLTDFTTHFSFTIQPTQNVSADGLTFFLAPSDSRIPTNYSSGGYLGLFSKETAFNNHTSKNQMVAVEFDTYQNTWDDLADDHVGIDINSIVSVKTVAWNGTFSDGRTLHAWISYNSTTYNLSVFLTYENNPVFGGGSTLWHIIDLRKVLPDMIRVGFSAATGILFQTYTVLSWEFNSSLIIQNITLSEPQTPTVRPKPKDQIPLIVGIVVPICVLCSIFGLFLFIIRRKRQMEMGGDDLVEDEIMDDEFEKGIGPKKFSFAELSRATKNFSEEGKLGEGGFGGVYKGLLAGSNVDIAVKRISGQSKQGKKEYISEVRIISRLRHKNLVQLIGCCHEKRELLLVYEYMANGSLDNHLFGKGVPLTWALRYRVAHGLANALLYLHEDWEQCVVHRDIKSSNVMLDSEFNAKLGDFGLARFVDHGHGDAQTSVLAGTMGYFAPECLSTGKSSKESDVYSYGVVALEIACGRKPVEPSEETNKVRLVQWVWDLYGKGQILDAADVQLNKEFVETQIECLMIVGLWCCHPDPIRRPSIRQVINVLNFEAPLPTLPSKLPVPMYFGPELDMNLLNYTTTGNAYSEKYQTTPRSFSTTSASFKW